MVAEIKVTPEIDITELLNAADEKPVVLERNGTRYRRARQDMKEDIWEGYDPEEVRAALQATVGSWSDLDTDRLIEEIYEARERGVRPFDRP
ncbi:MAG: hypothetical protein ACRDJW_03980 [Thermomicrobiales bacterium]